MPQNTIYLGARELIYVTDPEGNLQQMLIYIERINQDRIAKRQEPLGIVMPQAMRAHLSLVLGEAASTLTDLQLLFQAISLETESQLMPYRAFAHGDMKDWLMQLALHIPADVHVVFGGDYWDATKHPVPNKQPNIVHHQLLSGHILINTQRAYPENVTVILGNRDINKERMWAELRESYLAHVIDTAKMAVRSINDEVLSSLIRAASAEKLDDVIKAFWYQQVTDGMVKEKLVWATQNPGDFFIYKGMLAIIKTALQNSGCTVNALREAMLQKLQEQYDLVDYWRYMFANTLGAPGAIASFEQEYKAYYGEDFTLESFFSTVRPLYSTLNDLGQLMQRVILADGTSILLVHGHFSANVLHVADELHADFPSLPKPITSSLDSMVDFYNQFLVIARRQSFDSPMWLKLQDLALPPFAAHRKIESSIITEEYMKQYPVSAETQSDYAQLILDSHLKAIIVGHLPQRKGSVYRTGENLIFAVDNGKEGYSALVLNAAGVVTFYVADSFVKLLEGNIEVRNYIYPILMLTSEVSELGKSFKFNEAFLSMLIPENDSEKLLAVSESLRTGIWRVDYIDANDVIISQNGGAPRFENDSRRISREIFNTYGMIIEERAKRGLARSPSAYLAASSRSSLSTSLGQFLTDSVGLVTPSNCETTPVQTVFNVTRK